MGESGDRPLSLLSAAAAPSTAQRVPPTRARRSDDCWTARSQSKIQPAISAILTLAGLNSLAWAQRWAVHRGMPSAHWALSFWLCLFVLLFLHVAIHELGHAVVAWALYYRVRVVSIGPFTISHDRYGYHSGFDWKRLFHTGGYTGSMPTSRENARWKHIAVVAAGPLASLAAGLVFALATVLLPGTAIERYWWFTATGAMIGLLFGLISLMPVGSADGSMLFHLVFGTGPGRILLAVQARALDQQEAIAEHDRADFAKEVEIKRRILEQALQAGPSNSMAIASSHQTLGHALLFAEDWSGAEAEFTRALSFEAELRADPALAAGVWTGLVIVRSHRQREVETQQALAAAVPAIRRRKRDRDAVHRGVACAMLAQVRTCTANWDEAVREAAEGLKAVRLTPERLILYANLFTAQAEAYFNSAQPDQGLSAALAAAETLRSSAMPADRRNLAAHALGQLGDALWRAGQTASSIEYLREGVRGLEEGGAAIAAAAYRIRLCTILRGLGRFTEAVRSLPQETGLPAHLRRSLLAETIELALAAEAAGPALEHGRALVDLWRAETSDCEVERAAAEGLLARAHLAAGAFAEAESVARNAAGVLEPARHPEAARCLLTIAAAVRRTTGAPPPELAGEARRLIESCALLTVAEKARWMSLPGMEVGEAEAAAGVSAGS